MSFDKIVEDIIQEAMERGDFDNLPGKGKPIDLTAYFEMPEKVRMAYSVLKRAGMTAPEVVLLKEIAELKQVWEATIMVFSRTLDKFLACHAERSEASLPQGTRLSPALAGGARVGRGRTLPHTVPVSFWRVT